MTTCTVCGRDVTGKRFCPQCGTPVQPASTVADQFAPLSTCPRCGVVAEIGATFCAECGSALYAQAPAPAAIVCSTCGRHNDPGMAVCTNCGRPLTPASALTTPSGQSPYGGLEPSMPPSYAPPQYPPTQGPYGPQYPVNPPSYSPYIQGGYYPGPAMVRCPACGTVVPLGTAHCPHCHTSLVHHSTLEQIGEMLWGEAHHEPHYGHGHHREYHHGGHHDEHHEW